VETTRALARLAQRSVHLQCTIQDVQIWIGDRDDTVQVAPATLKRASTPSR